MIRPLSIAAALMLGSPAFAQTVPAPIAQAQAAPAELSPSPEEAAFEARSEAFGARIQTMAQEMQDAVTSAGTDMAKRSSDLDAIEARYKPDVDAFVADLQAFIENQAGALSPDEAAQMRAGVTAALPQIQGVPRTVRAQIEQGAAAAGPPAAP